MITWLKNLNQEYNVPAIVLCAFVLIFLMSTLVYGALYNRVQRTNQDKCRLVCYAKGYSASELTGLNTCQCIKRETSEL